MLSAQMHDKLETLFSRRKEVDLALLFGNRIARSAPVRKFRQADPCLSA